MSADYPRDLIGYGPNPPHPHWPGNARIALSFVLNYEEGGERNILHGDKESEAFLSEMVAAQPLQGERNMSMESLYEYGSRAGVWRVLKVFKEAGIPLTIFAVAMAAQRHPDVIRAMVAQGHEICSHGYRWIDYQYMDEAQEREHMLEAIRILTEISGERPLGWYTGRTGPNTRRLVMEEGGFLYDSDTYDDDLPYWERNNGTGKPHLVIPYTLDTNDMRFTQVRGLQQGRRLLRVPEGRLRRAVRRGCRGAEDALHRPALPADRPPCPAGLAAAFHRVRERSRAGVVRPPCRHRPPLA